MCVQSRISLCYNRRCMKNIGVGAKKIFREDRGLLVLMVILFLMGLELVLHTLFHFKVGVTSMYIGYSDSGKFSGGDYLSLWNSGGYRTGGWVDMAVFIILGIIFGVFHNIMAMKIYERRGKGYTRGFVVISMIVCSVAFVTLARLLGEI